ncbi:hypothetical protein PHYBOEH_006496 [Phytophthora boehmeriae]|uniref:Methenyltetrahydrofolate cyclohydrolase n=1 Tax=Phytophthora boehmeriae TaxID=109152 RepID=A0A8T1WFV6_9STRA|nr:hypothetical protein PHYBOEH_006496 [Phytophthora boehmeriae]
MARVIDGKAIAKALRAALKGDLLQYQAPALGLIMVGDRKDSALYVRNKNTACCRTGIRSENFLFDEGVSQDTIVHKVEELNQDPAIDGILVQLPLPGTELNAQQIIDRIQPDKDVDGLHPFNAGELAMRGRYPYLIPCTAKGIMALLDEQHTPLRGKTAVVIGRSNLVGNPVSMLLQKRDATVILCHSKTEDLPHYVQQADVLVAACGQPYLSALLLALDLAGDLSFLPTPSNLQALNELLLAPGDRCQPHSFGTLGFCHHVAGCLEQALHSVMHEAGASQAN